MSLRHGRPAVSIPGPSVIPDRVLNAMRRPMPNIYEGELIELSHSVLADLPTLARTTQPGFISISNGHGAWEMATTNTLSRGDRVLVLESGRFAVSWADMMQVSGIKSEILPAAPGGAVDPAAVEARLRDDAGHEFAAVIVVQVDTATSVRNDIAAVRRAIDAAGHPALFMVDCIASLGCEPYEMDEWGVDVTVAATQKGLMVPPGLGFVWASEKAMAAHERADLRSAYWDWSARLNPEEHYHVYCGTPPIQHLWGMREAIDMLFEEGFEQVWHRHQVMGEAVRAAMGMWATPGGLGLAVPDPSARSNSVTTVLTGNIDANELRRICEEEAGLTLGIGLADYNGRAFRIGHMGHLNPPMLLGTLGTIESALHALDAPMDGSGVGAAARLIGTHL